MTYVRGDERMANEAWKGGVEGRGPTMVALELVRSVPYRKHVAGQLIGVVPHPVEGIEECHHMLSMVFLCAYDVREEQNLHEILC
jgi:hypothetical protein